MASSNSDAIVSGQPPHEKAQPQATCQPAHDRLAHSSESTHGCPRAPNAPNGWNSTRWRWQRWRALKHSTTRAAMQPAALRSVCAKRRRAAEMLPSSFAHHVCGASKRQVDSEAADVCSEQAACRGRGHGGVRADAALPSRDETSAAPPIRYYHVNPD